MEGSIHFPALNYVFLDISRKKKFPDLLLERQGQNNCMALVTFISGTLCISFPIFALTNTKPDVAAFRLHCRDKLYVASLSQSTVKNVMG